MLSTLSTLSFVIALSAVHGQTLPYRDDMSSVSGGYWTDFGSVTQSNADCVGTSPCTQLNGYAELYFLHFSLSEHSTIFIGFNLCFDCDAISPAAATEHFNVYYSCGASEFVAPNWAVLKQYDGTLPAGSQFKAEKLALPASCDHAADLNLAFISFTASSSMYIDSLSITTPTLNPTPSPSALPSRSPTNIPSSSPSRGPTHLPSTSPSKMPSLSPSSSPTKPTQAPTTHTANPTTHTASPSLSPSVTPTKGPSTTPSRSPSAMPSTSPSDIPTVIPSMAPTDPTLSPSEATPSPTEITSSPTAVTRSPSLSPSRSPSGVPTASPTEPTMNPITYLEHLKLIADQYSPTATPGPTMAPFGIHSVHSKVDTTQSPTEQPSVDVTTARPTANDALQNDENTDNTPSPVLIQYVFVREPTMAPTNGAAAKSLYMVMIAVALLLLF